MNTEAKKWVVICLCFALAIVGISFLVFSRGSSYGQGITKKQYQDSMRLYRHSFDSLQSEINRKTLMLDTWQRQRDTLLARDSFFRAQLTTLSKDYNSILNQYHALHHYDTISRGDVLRYLSDSVAAIGH